MSCIVTRFSRLIHFSVALLFAALAQAAPPHLDCHGDPLPAGATARMGTTRLRHGDAVCHVVYSPDGQFLASLSRDRTVRIWEAKTSRQIHLIQEKDVDYYAVAWAPDSMTLAVAGGDTFHGGKAGIRIFDVKTGHETKCLDGHNQPAYCLAYSSDGNTLISVSHEQVLSWDMARAEKQSEWKLGSTATLAVSPDRTTLAWVDAEAEDKMVHLAHAADGKELPGFAGHTFRIVSVAFSPNGKYLASGNPDEPIILWDAKTHAVVRRFEHREGGLKLRFSADSTKLASACADGTVCLWDVETGLALPELAGYLGSVNCLAFTPDGNNLALAGADSQIIHVWEVRTGKPVEAAPGHSGKIQALAYSPDGKLLASAGGGWRADDRAIALWETATGKLVRKFVGHVDKIYGLQFSPDGKRLISAGEKDDTFRIWDVATGKELPHWRRKSVKGQGREENSEEIRVTAVAWSRDGKWVASAHDNGQVVLWDATKGVQLLVYKGHEAAVHSLAFSPDSKWLLSGGVDRAVHLWNCASGKLIRNFEDAGDTIKCVAFSPDGRVVAASAGDYEGSVHLWDAEIGRSLGRLNAPHARIHQIAFSPDGRLLTGTGPDNTLCLWEVATRAVRSQFPGHPQGELAVAFAPDGRTVATGGQDTTVLTWDVNYCPLTADGLGAKDLEQLWTDLGSKDGRLAHAAICGLLAEPERALKMIEQRLRAFSTLDASRMSQALSDLDNDRFQSREKATRDLLLLGELAEPFLRERLEGQPSLEVRTRVQVLLSKLEGAVLPTEHLRALRALEILEHIGGSEAHMVFESLAGQSPPGRLSRDAQASLDRMGQRR
jgi:WD40 repeat protein